MTEHRGTGDAQVTAREVVRSTIRSFRGRVAAATVLLCGHQVGEALVPVLVGVVIDRAVATGDVGSLVVWLLVLAADFAMLSYSYRFGARQALHADLRADAGLRTRVAARLLDHRGGAETGRLPGSITSIAVADAKRVAVMNFWIPTAAAAAAALVVAAVALLRISLPLGLLILLGTPPLLWLIGRVGRPLERRSGAEQERAARAAGTAADLVSGIRVLKGLGAGPAAAEQYAASSRTALGATLRATRAEAGFLGTVQLANGLFLAVIALVGGLLALDGSITVGNLVSAVGLAQFLVGPLQTLGIAGARFAQARASAGRIAEILSAPPAVGAGREGRAAGTTDPAAGRAALAVTGLRHGPLDGLDLEVPAGQLLGVVAPDPSAATALARCLARDVAPDEGRILLGGTGVDDLAPAATRSTLLVAAHDAHLFTGTVLDNVTAATGDGAPGSVTVEAMAAARADQAVEALPQGADTPVTSRGSSLSGGQRQRVALARALAADPPVLVLHDPTTAVDAVTESEIAARLREHRTGRTTVLLTTSPALLAVTDRVVVLRDGRVAADATHTELMTDDTDYRRVVTG
ncbi:ABC transporter transmembrane domain-containing protein [Pseudonocardia alni]|uniref:ABC transporter transmembrane domain-containing protein n=1 Tax=Pseudonocardia alni TaxID=33907 RepID=UPI0006CB0108|nr:MULTISPECIES: ABC transporter ATP-binding protein [Pseudonocardia]ALE77887.1 multidrug ABC transporter ATPase [Pseudonocardia sp. AL041005-10]